jgi:hypothetical protein
VPDDVRTVVVGRTGWVQDADEVQGLVRVDLTDPENADTALGFLMMTCNEDGIHVYFTADPASRLKVPERLSDGFAHFFSGEIGSTSSMDGDSVTIYSTFASGQTFLSSRSRGLGDPVESLVDFLIDADRTATLILSPRLVQGGFRPDTRIRFIFEPGGDGASALPKEEALPAFMTDCRDRFPQA